MEQKDNNKQYQQLCEILKKAEIPMDQALTCIKRKHNYEEKKETKNSPYININDLKCYETKAEML